MRKWKLAGAVLALTFALTACGNDDEATKEKTNETDVAGEQGTNEVTGQYPMTISPTIASTDTEEAGTVNFEDITFESMPEKMVVFDYGFLDTLDTLGVEGVVGVPQDSNLPSNLEEYAGDEYVNVGTLKEPLLEDIAEIGPDAIFISGRQSPFYEELSEIAPVVFVGTSQDDYWNTFLKSVDVAAKMFDKEAEAEEHIAKIESSIEEVKTLAGNYETTLVTMYNEGKLSGFARNSRFAYIYDIYGFKPVIDDIAASSHGSNFGFEAILDMDPEVLFVIDRTAAVGDQSNIAKDMENKIIEKTQAYQNKRIVYLDGVLWYISGGGLTSELAKIDEILAELK
ncbi:siderophore ABC transporter substrate-binding protein [Bacillus sinesaloumensis]|uniref:siderophore ABC transporter substrate-binding protein n=1 Tax=Litchfieldia sinesaloumensis TaxID=1926280 RepID=UPI0009883B26|nr:siderophore ABC transporter substrate-binding protein [Bacillus sinesaloumensis]